MNKRGNKECKIIEVEDIDIPYKVNCTMIEPMKLRKSRVKEKEEVKKMSKEFIER